MRDDISRWKTLNNVLPQGSVLAPNLFNLYTADAPATTSKKIKYADDEILMHEADSFSELEEVLNADLEVMGAYYRDWRLTPSPHTPGTLTPGLKGRRPFDKNSRPYFIFQF